MNTQPTENDPHDGMTCAQVEALVDLRTRQMIEARHRLADEPRAQHPASLVRDITRARREARELRADLEATQSRLARREEQATRRLTPEEYRSEALAVVGAVEARIRGDRDALEALAPASVAALRAQAATAVEALADLAQANPDIPARLRAAILADTNPEETR